MSGFGNITWWGFSPALDLQHELTVIDQMTHSTDDTTDDVVNVLIIGAADIRHVLCTLACEHRYPKKRKKFNFYLVENNIEVFCREMALLRLAVFSPMEMGLQEKTETFLELFGNTLIRSQTSDYVKSTAKECIKIVTTLEENKDLPFINMSLLKFKERDMMESIFKFWERDDKHQFDISRQWDSRLRQYLETRYDSRQGVFDWDHSMKLIDRQAGIINSREYKRWRENGLAFDLRDGDYNFPNRTMASTVAVKTPDGIRCHRGYHGDIVTGPFISFGIESESQDFFKQSNGMYIKQSSDVACHNIMSYFYELTYSRKYNERLESANIVDVTEEINIDKKMANMAEIFFVSWKTFPKLKEKAQFQKFFHVAFVSNSLLHMLTPEMQIIFNPNALLIMETAKYLLDVRIEQIEEFSKKCVQIAADVGFNPVRLTSEDHKKDCVLRFVNNRPEPSKEV